MRITLKDAPPIPNDFDVRLLGAPAPVPFSKRPKALDANDRKAKRKAQKRARRISRNHR